MYLWNINRNRNIIKLLQYNKTNNQKNQRNEVFTIFFKQKSNNKPNGSIQSNINKHILIHANFVSNCFWLHSIFYCFNNPNASNLSFINHENLLFSLIPILLL